MVPAGSAQALACPDIARVAVTVGAEAARVMAALVYATCTFNPEENEEVLDGFLADHSDFMLIEPSRHPGFSPGRSNWIAVGADLAPVLARAVRLWPHLAPGEGHFIAVLERSAAAPADPPPKPWRPVKLPRAVEEAYRAFCAAALRDMDPRRHTKLHEGESGSLRDSSCPSWINSSYALVGSYLYAPPAGLPDLTSLRYLHPGWWLGTVKKDRFEPSHASALGLRVGSEIPV